MNPSTVVLDYASGVIIEFQIATSDESSIVAVPAVDADPILEQKKGRAMYARLHSNMVPRSTQERSHDLMALGPRTVRIEQIIRNDSRTRTGQQE